METSKLPVGIQLYGLRELLEETPERFEKVAVQVKDKLIGMEGEKEENETGFFQFRPIVFGQQIWEPILEASIETEGKWIVVEQDEHYDLPSLECARRSREYLKILGW